MSYNNQFFASVVLYLILAMLLAFVCFKFASLAMMNKRKGLKYKRNRKKFRKFTFFSIVSGIGSAFTTFISVIAIISATV